MKKLHYLLLGAAALTMASCSQEDIIAPDGGGNYNVTVRLPGDMATRAVDMNTGQVANNLNYVVYDAADDTYVTDGTAKFTGTGNALLTTTVGLNLANGKSYKIAFFAQSADSEDVYDFDAQSGKITVHYENMTNEGTGQFDTYDCFVNQLETGTIGSETVNTTITLYRPIAQINWGTSDFDEDAVEKTYGPDGEFLQATLTTNAYNTFSLIDNDVDIDAGTVPVTLSNFTAPLQASGAVAAYPYIDASNQFDYITMQYLLAPKDGAVYNLNLAVNNELNTAATEHVTNEVAVSNAPVQANFKTNIYGSLLTDNVNITVTKDPNWYKPDNNYGIWDGTTVTQPAQVDGIFQIYTPGEWQWLETYNNGNAWNGKIALCADLDFNGYEVKGIRFHGDFDGQGHTMKNFTLIPRSSYATGLFAGDVGSGTLNVSNVTFDNITAVNHNSNDYGWVGVVTGDMQNGITANLSNVHVTNVNLNGIKCVAGLVAFVASGCTLNVTDCSVENSYLTNIPVAGESGFVAGLVGRAVGTVNIIEGNSVSNVNIEAYYATNRGENSIADVVGGQNITAGVTVSNVTIKATEVTTDIKVNGSTYSTLAEAITAAPSGSTIQLGLDYYDLPSNIATNKTLTLTGIGAGYTVVNSANAYWTANGCNFTFENLSMDSFVNIYNHTSMGFKGLASGTYNNVTFNGEFHVFSGTASFNNCEFNYNQASGTNYQLWCQTNEAITITDCVMNCGPARALLVYAAEPNSYGGDITINGLKVTASTNTDKGVVEIHTENYTSAGTITIANVTYPASLFGGGLWREINNNSGATTNLYNVIAN